MIRTKKSFLLTGETLIFKEEIIKPLQQKYFIFMLEVKDGDVFLCVDHWKYIDWKKKSPRILLYTDQSLKNGYYFHYYENTFHQF